MKLVRMPLAVFALVSVVACSMDVTGPRNPEEQKTAPVLSPSGPLFNGGYIGSGDRADSTESTTATPDTTTVTVSDTTTFLLP